jgi:hypothetical protein
LSSKTVRNIQLALFDEDFDLDPEQRAFIDELIANGGNRRGAMLAARPALSPKSADVIAKRQLAKPEVQRYLLWRQAQCVLRSQLTEDELVEKSRRVYLAAMGELPLRKTIVQRGEDGTLTAEDVDIRDPSLTAANTAIETLRKLGGFGLERTETRMSGSVALAELSDEEREARLEQLARKAGLLPGGAN